MQDVFGRGVVEAMRLGLWVREWRAHGGRMTLGGKQVFRLAQDDKWIFAGWFWNGGASVPPRQEPRRLR